METAEIKSRIEKKEAQIVKIEKRIAKWSKGLTPEVIELAKTLSWRDLQVYKKQHPELTYSTEDYNSGDADELRSATLELEDAQNTLNKYKNALKIADEKDNTEKIQVLVDFLNNWKDLARDYVEENVKVYNEYLKTNNEYIDMLNYRYKYEKDLGTEAYKNKVRELYSKTNTLMDNVHPWTTESYERRSHSLNMNTLNKILDKEAERKYFDLVNRISDKAGEIKDVSMLRIDGKGNLNGFVKGSKAKVYVQTIIAGGENAGRIVNVKRGPIAHYRTIVNIIK